MDTHQPWNESGFHPNHTFACILKIPNHEILQNLSSKKRNFVVYNVVYSIKEIRKFQTFLTIHKLPKASLNEQKIRATQTYSSIIQISTKPLNSFQNTIFHHFSMMLYIQFVMKFKLFSVKKKYTHNFLLKIFHHIHLLADFNTKTNNLIILL